VKLPLFTLTSIVIFILISSCGEVAPVGDISKEFLRLAKVKALDFKPLSEAERQKVESLSALSSYQYRLGEWADKWAAARDGRYLIYKGGAAKSANRYAFFIVVWSIAENRAVFVEVGHHRTGAYPSGLMSSP
jgi:hypothetical protein